jgi:hypothetical protein
MLTGLGILILIVSSTVLGSACTFCCACSKFRFHPLMRSCDWVLAATVNIVLPF